jgi:hypothetical protein
MTYANTAHPHDPAGYSREEMQHQRLLEWCLLEARGVADAALTRCGCRLDALAFVQFAWADPSLGEPVDGIVRDTAVNVLLAEGNGTERDAWEVTRAIGVDTYAAAVHAITALLTADVPVRQAVAA